MEETRDAVRPALGALRLGFDLGARGNPVFSSGLLMRVVQVGRAVRKEMAKAAGWEEWEKLWVEVRGPLISWYRSPLLRGVDLGDDPWAGTWWEIVRVLYEGPPPDLALKGETGGFGYEEGERPKFPSVRVSYYDLGGEMHLDEAGYRHIGPLADEYLAFLAYLSERGELIELHKKFRRYHQARREANLHQLFPPRIIYPYPWCWDEDYGQHPRRWTPGYEWEGGVGGEDFPTAEMRRLDEEVFQHPSSYAAALLRSTRGFPHDLPDRDGPPAHRPRGWPPRGREEGGRGA